MNIFADNNEWAAAVLEQGEHSNRIAQIKDEIKFLESQLKIRRGLLGGTGIDVQKILSQMHEIDKKIGRKNLELANEIVNQQKNNL